MVGRLCSVDKHDVEGFWLANWVDINHRYSIDVYLQRSWISKVLGSLLVVHLSDCTLIKFDQVIIAIYGVAACKCVNTRGCYPSNDIILITRFSKSSLVPIFVPLPSSLTSNVYTLRNFAKWHHGSEKKILVQTGSWHFSSLVSIIFVNSLIS